MPSESRPRTAPRPSRAAVLLLMLVAGGICACAPPPPRNLVVVVVDTLRPDHMSVYGYARPTTPHLEWRARRAAVYERAYSAAPWTLPSVASLLTGLPPSRHAAGFARPHDRLPRRHATLATHLRKHGWQAAGFLCNPYLHEVFGTARGFDPYDNDTRSFDEGTSAYRQAPATIERAIAWLEAEPREPFFLLLHLFDPHAPLQPPPPFLGRFGGSVDGPLRPPVTYGRVEELVAAGAWNPALHGQLVALYDEEIAFVDHALERFFSRLESLGLWDRSLVVLTSDHGEELLERDRYDHAHALFEEQIRAPLILWGPGVRPGWREIPVSLTDVAPTALEALAVEPPSLLPGRSLWRDATDRAGLPGRAILTEGVEGQPAQASVVRWPYKGTVSADGATLFDLSSDPGERRDLSAQRADLLRRLLAELIAMRGREAGEEAPIDDDLRAVLRSLGYLD